MDDILKIDKYKKDGFIIIKDFIAKNTVPNVLSCLQIPFKSMIEKHNISNHPSDIDNAIIQLFERSYEDFMGASRQLNNNPLITNLFCGEKTINTLKYLGISQPYICGIPMIVFNCKYLAKRTFHHKTPIHQDWRSMQGSNDSVVVWVPLVDVDKENGSIEVIPGSHNCGLFDTVEDEWYMRIPESIIDNNEFKTVKMEAGDAVIFSSLIVHRSGNNVTSKPRWACQFRFNNLDDKSFIERSFSNPYTHRPNKDIDIPYIRE